MDAIQLYGFSNDGGASILQVLSIRGEATPLKTNFTTDCSLGHPLLQGARMGVPQWRYTITTATSVLSTRTTPAKSAVRS